MRTENTGWSGSILPGNLKRSPIMIDLFSPSGKAMLFRRHPNLFAVMPPVGPHEIYHARKA